MPRPQLNVMLRTPQAVVFEGAVRSLRVPTATGQVGLRPRSEPTVLAIEPGLILLRTAAGLRFAGSAGGLLHVRDSTASLLTPLAVTGDDIESVSSQLDRLLSEPNEELEARRTLSRLESRILRELRDSERES